MSTNQLKTTPQMSSNVKRTSFFLAIVTIYFIGVSDTQILKRLSNTTIGLTEKKQQKQTVNASKASRQSNNYADITSSSIEPYKNRWQRRFSNNNNSTRGYFFFKHIRKAGGTTLRGYFKDVFAYHGITHITRDDYPKIRKGWRAPPDVLYVEHEFQTMDTECANVDERWDRSLKVITLRHPIERHMSEFFFSGHGTNFHIDRTMLYTNETYTQQLSSFLNENIPNWMAQEGGGKTIISKYGPAEGRFNMYFGRFYTDNFQLRALSGCSSQECFAKRLGNTTTTTIDVLEDIEMLHPLTNASLYQNPKPSCTQYFHKTNGLFDPCAKSQTKNEEDCKLGCDGPCFYPSVAWGPLDQSDVDKAIEALEKFDLILIMETFDDPDQAAFMADVLGVPRDALSKHNASNVVVQKSNSRDKTHFYRDLLNKLSPSSLKMLMEQNKLEIDFFEKALEVNRRKTDEWKMEVQWQGL